MQEKKATNLTPKQETMMQHAHTIIEENDVMFESWLILTLQLIVAKTVHESGEEPPKDWDTERVINRMITSLDECVLMTIDGLF